MKHHHSHILSAAVVILSLALVAGAVWLLCRTLPQKRQPDTVETLQTDGVFEQPAATVAPEREDPYEGELPAAPQPDTPDTSGEPAPQTPAGGSASGAGISEESRRLAAQALETMTLEEKLWQLFFVTPEAVTGVETATRAGEATRDALEQMPVGGLIYFSQNLEDREQVVEMLANTASYSRLGLFLGIDEEGGTVSRLGQNAALQVDSVGPMRDYGDAADPAAVYDAGQIIANSLTALGFNLDFAPVADVASGSSAVIGSRAFSTDASLCASLVRVMTGSLTDGGIVPCLKHFPGYGSASGDDHDGPASIDKTLEELEACDFLPFRAAIDDGAPVVMVSHLAAPNVTGGDTPSDLSSVIVTDILRNKLGFSNVIITDSQQMASITGSYTAAEAAVGALKAGADMILMPADLQPAYDGVLAAVQSGTLTEQRIDESVLRILQVKAQYGILTAAALNSGDDNS